MDTVFHSSSSVRKFGGAARDYEHIHSFFDKSKTFHPDWRHRSLLHHTFGLVLFESIYGETFYRESDNKLLQYRPICEQHILEDLGALPTPYWYLRELNTATTVSLDKLKTGISRADLALKLWACFGGICKDYEPILNWFDAAKAYIPDARRFIYTHTNFGIYVATQVFGYEYKLASSNKLLSTIDLVTKAIELEITIPLEVSALLSDMKLKRWMNGMTPEQRMRMMGIVNQEQQSYAER